MIIAQNVMYLMREHGVSEAQLARALDTSVMTVRRIVSGETPDPRISTLQRIADYFKISVDYLLHVHTHQPARGQSLQVPELIPVLDWSSFSEVNTLQELDLQAWSMWHPLLTDRKAMPIQHTFALRSTVSMQPRFPLGTLFVINQAETPVDGDLILVKIQATQQLTLRELVIDSPRWQLQPVIAGSDRMYFDAATQRIIGVVVVSIMASRESCG